MTDIRTKLEAKVREAIRRALDKLGGDGRAFTQEEVVRIVMQEAENDDELRDAIDAGGLRVTTRWPASRLHGLPARARP